jgi:hypothetical protein
LNFLLVHTISHTKSWTVAGLSLPFGVNIIVKKPWICLADVVYQHLGHKSAESKPCAAGAKCYSNHVFERTRGVPGNEGAPWGQNGQSNSDGDAVDMCFVDKKVALKLPPGVARTRCVSRGPGSVARQVGDPVLVGADRGGTKVGSTDDGLAELVEPVSAESAGQLAWQGQGLVKECVRRKRTGRRTWRFRTGTWFHRVKGE